MIVKCAVCGKEFDVLWPDQYRFKRGDAAHRTWLCSWGHLRQYDKGKEDVCMARTKKDGTPAKRPGPKPKRIEDCEPVSGVGITLGEIVTPEPINGGPWEKAEVSEETVVKAPEAEEKRPINQIGYKICGIEGEFGRFFYDRKFNRLDWTTPEGEEVSMDPVHWRIFVKQIPRVLEVLIAEAAK